MSVHSTISALDPNDPRLTETLIEYDPLAPITSPQALRLQSYSLTAKARSLQDCESFVYVYRCPNGHTWPVAITCHQRFCPKCAERIMLRLVKKYDAIDIGTEPFLAVEISIFSYKGGLSRGLLEMFSRDIGHGFKLLERTADSPLGAIWNIVPSPGKLTAYLLLWGDGVKSFERYRQAWSKLGVKISSRPAHQFSLSLQQIFDHAPSKDPLFRADCEYIFHGRRSVHTMGTLHLREKSPADSASEKSELFPSEENNGNNSDIEYPHKCPHCHLPASGISQRMHAADFRQSRLSHAYREVVNRE